MAASDKRGETPEQKASREAREAAAFKKFLENRKILIADSNAAARSSLFNVMKELGAKPSQLFLSNTYSAAAQAITEMKPHIVIAEYNLGKHCGLELLQSQREQRPKETKECIFVIVTGDTSQSAAARALEEDIDAYIIKPYTIDFVRRTIIHAAIQKIKPPPYLVKIEEGKKLLAEQKWDEAEAVFNEALTLEQTPTLAYYYLGQLKYFREVLPQAQASYMKGLKLNNIHYKCLVGMYELLVRMKRYEDAYEVMRKVARYFPANPKRLAEVLRLAITIKKYEDIEQYYLMFSNMDTRNETVVRYTTAALIVCGKYYLTTKQGGGKALDIFRKAAVTSANHPKILAEIIPIMVENGLGDDAKKFLEKFSPETQSTKEYFLCDFLILNHKGKLALIIDRGRTLIGRGITDPRIYEVMIERSLHAGLGSAAEDLLREAVAKYPEKAERFNQIFSATKTAAA